MRVGGGYERGSATEMEENVVASIIAFLIIVVVVILREDHN